MKCLQMSGENNHQVGSRWDKFEVAYEIVREYRKVVIMSFAQTKHYDSVKIAFSDKKCYYYMEMTWYHVWIPVMNEAKARELYITSKVKKEIIEIRAM